MGAGEADVAVARLGLLSRGRERQEEERGIAPLVGVDGDREGTVDGADAMPGHRPNELTALKVLLAY